MLLTTLLVLILSAHLLAVNLAAAAPLVCLWLDARDVKRGDRLAGELGRYLLRQSLLWLTAGMVLGGITLAMVWVARWEVFAEVAARLPAARFWWAIPEIAFYYVCVGGYLWLWSDNPGGAAWAVPLRRFLGLLAATNLLYHFPLLFTVIGVYGARSAGEGPLDFRQAMLDAEVFSQFLHHVLASFAVVGMAVMGFALRLARRHGEAEDVTRIGAWGGRIALVPTVLQLFVGTYVLIALPESARARVMGGDILGTVLFGAAVVGAVMLMHRLASISFGETGRGNLIGSMALLVLVIVVMVGTRERVRQGRFLSQRELEQNAPLTPSLSREGRGSSYC